MLSWLRSLARGYDKLLRRHPLPVKCVTSGAVVCTSDVSVQLLCNRDQQYNAQRTILIGVGYGALWFAPVMHGVTTGWAKVLPSTSAGSLAFKTVVDMLTSFPVNLCAVISAQAISQGKPVMPSLERNVVPGLLDGWRFWPVWSIVMYGVVPLHYRVLWLNTGSFGWNAYLIWRVETNKASASTAVLDNHAIL